jgi:membrane protein implicated in regulation of membrane protease activity
MATDFLSTHAWVFWLGLILVCVIIEVSTIDFTFLMLAIGSVGGLLTGLFGAPWWVQILVAGILSLLLLFIVRPALHRALRRGRDSTPTNVEALLGLSGVVMTDFVDGQGHVKLANGETWTARLSQLTDDRPVLAGERVVVTAIDGATAVVVPAERTAL